VHDPAVLRDPFSQLRLSIALNFVAVLTIRML
jgi:hypothetical protein